MKIITLAGLLFCFIPMQNGFFSQTFTYHDAASSGINFGDVWDVTERMSDNSLYFAFYGQGVGVYNHQTNTWSQHKNSFGTPYYLGNNSMNIKAGDGDTIYSYNTQFLSAFDGVNWIAAPMLQRGYIDVDQTKNLWVLKDGSAPLFQKYFRGTLTTFDETDFPLLQDINVYQLYCGSDNKVYICHETGLAIFDGTNLQNSYFQDTIVEKVFIDSDGDLWATGDYWFAELKNGNWRYYNTTTEPNWPGSFGRNGDITQANNGDMYITSGYRLYVIDGQGNVTKFDYTDPNTQMPNTANYFPELFKDSRGHIWMGVYQHSGVVEIDPGGSGTSGISPLKKVEDPTFSLFPNPANTNVMISFVDENFARNLIILDIKGNVVKDLHLSADLQQSISTEGLAAGMYTVVLKGDRSVMYQKMLVQ